MKRSNEDYGTISKRQKLGGSNIPGKYHNQNNGSRYNGQGGRQQGKTGYPTAPANDSPVQQSKQPTATAQGHMPADPLLSLETSLRLLVDRPEATTSQFGPEALDQVQGLLKALSTRKATSNASLDLFQPQTMGFEKVTAYFPGEPLRDYSLPSLPQVPEGPYSTTPFTHSSAVPTDRVTTINDLTYERLEFLGDAYIEIIATRLIFSRYAHYSAGRQAQIREQLVKNETLATYSRAYNFDKRVQVSVNDRNLLVSDGASSKAGTKILADVFEAYVAAIILSDPEEGFQRTEAWLTELWAPILLHSFGPEATSSLEGKYNPKAKVELQQRVGAQGVKIEYLEERPMEQLKSSTRYFIGLYLTGWGYEKGFLGKGEGQNKVEAGNRAAMEAMAVNREIVEDCERQLLEERRVRREAKMKEEGKAWNGVKAGKEA